MGDTTAGDVGCALLSKNGEGTADDKNGWKFDPANKLAHYLKHCQNWIDLDSTIIGGCCGTNPEYTKAYSQLKK